MGNLKQLRCRCCYYHAGSSACSNYWGCTFEPDINKIKEEAKNQDLTVSDIMSILNFVTNEG